MKQYQEMAATAVVTARITVQERGALEREARRRSTGQPRPVTVSEVLRGLIQALMTREHGSP